MVSTLSKHKMSIEIAKIIFNNTKYETNEEDIKSLSDNIILLEGKGLSKLNKRLIDGGRNIGDTFAEHNFAVELALRHNQISYEPEELPSPPDFKVKIDSITYWIQMKNLSKLERENRQSKIVNTIKEAAKSIEIGKFFILKLSDNFGDKDVQEFIGFMKDKAISAKEGEKYYFKKDKAIVEFLLPNNKNLNHLTLGASGDLDMVEITGLAKEQIKESILKGASAFTWDINPNTINIIVMEADKQKDIDICEAVYGTEFEIFSQNSLSLSWSRKCDGLFKNQDIAKKIVGVIATRRKDKWKPICNYSFILYINDLFKDRIDDINKLLSLDKIIYCDMRPQGSNFGLD